MEGGGGGGGGGGERETMVQYKKYLVETTPEWLLQFQSTHSTA